MKKETILNLNSNLAKNEQERLALEQKIKDNQKTLQKITEEFETDLENLKSLHEIEESLRKELYTKQKESMHDNLNLESMKKVLGVARPLLSRIKATTIEKAKAIKGYIDGSTVDKEWLENRYSEYKKICLKKGEEIKSKEDFKRIALSLKNVQGEIKELNLYEMINKLSVDAGHATQAVKKVIKSINLESKVEKVSSLLRKKEMSLDDEPENKSTIFTEWASHKSINLSDSPENLYNNYLEYLSKKYSELEITTISYSKKSGSFTKALNKHLKTS